MWTGVLGSRSRVLYLVPERADNFAALFSASAMTT